MIIWLGDKTLGTQWRQNNLQMKLVQIEKILICVSNVWKQNRC